MYGVGGCCGTRARGYLLQPLNRLRAFCLLRRRCRPCCRAARLASGLQPLSRYLCFPCAHVLV